MKTGIELIAEERKCQLEKYGFTPQHDGKINSKKQLIYVAETLMSFLDARNFSNYELKESAPNGWDLDLWLKICHKPYTERLAIAASFIAAEIDRLNYISDGAND